MNTRELAEFLSHEPEYPLSADMIETYLREYKERVCREQRELCARSYLDCLGYDVDKNTKAIRNAPEPEE